MPRSIFGVQRQIFTQNKISKGRHLSEKWLAVEVDCLTPIRGPFRPAGPGGLKGKLGWLGGRLQANAKWMDV